MPFAYNFFMPWPVRELHSDIRSRLQTLTVWNTVTCQNYPIATALLFIHLSSHPKIGCK